MIPRVHLYVGKGHLVCRWIVLKQVLIFADEVNRITFKNAGKMGEDPENGSGSDAGDLFRPGDMFQPSRDPPDS